MLGRTTVPTIVHRTTSGFDGSASSGVDASVWAAATVARLLERDRSSDWVLDEASFSEKAISAIGRTDLLGTIADEVALTKARVTAFAHAKPILVASGLMSEGDAGYRFRMPFEIAYENRRGTRRQAIDVEIVVRAKGDRLIVDDIRVDA